MKQISTKRETARQEEGNVPASIGMIVAAFIGAIEGIIVYLLLINLDKAEVLTVSPRPAYMISAGIAWRFLRTIDNHLKSR